MTINKIKLKTLTRLSDKGFDTHKKILAIDMRAARNHGLDDDIGGIIDLLVKDTNHRLADQEISIELTPEAKKYVAENGYDPSFGARPLKRTIQTELEDRLAEALLEGTVKERSEILVTCPEAGQESERRLVFTETGASEKPKKRRKPVKAAET